MDCWKAHGIREYQISGEGVDVPLVTVKARLERLPDIVKDYEPCNQCKMDELRLLFETFKFRKLTVPARPVERHYFANAKS